MDIRSAFVAHLQSAKAIQPGQGPFNYPTMSAQFFTALHPSPGNSREDVMPTQEPSVIETVVALVGMQFVRSFARSATLLANSRDGLHHFFQQGCVVLISSRVLNYQRDALYFNHKMALRARFSPIRRSGSARFFRPRAQARCLHPEKPATNPVVLPPPVVPARPGAICPILLQLASHAAASNRSSHCHNPFPAAAFPRECRF